MPLLEPKREMLFAYELSRWMRSAVVKLIEENKLNQQTIRGMTAILETAPPELLNADLAKALLHQQVQLNTFPSNFA